MPTKIKKCTCESKYQDKEHGKTLRVHNTFAKGSRCTVCGAVKGDDKPVAVKGTDDAAKPVKKKK